MYWGILAGFMTAFAGGAGNGFFNFKNWSTLGWNVFSLYVSLTWFPSFFFWICRLIANYKNDTLNYLFVLFSNWTMLGPVGFYWASILLVIVGWACDKFVVSTYNGVFFGFFVIVSQIAGLMQVTWIHQVQQAYQGDKNATSDTVNKWEQNTKIGHTTTDSDKTTSDAAPGSNIEVPSVSITVSDSSLEIKTLL